MIDIKENVELLRRSGRFCSEDEFFEEVFQALLDKRPEFRIELAIERYKTGDVSISRRSPRGYGPEDFKELLCERGISRDIGFLNEEEQDARLSGSS